MTKMKIEEALKVFENMTEEEYTDFLSTLSEEAAAELEEGLHHLLGRAARDTVKRAGRAIAHNIPRAVGALAGAGIAHVASGGNMSATVAGGVAGHVAGAAVAQKAGEKYEKGKYGDTKHNVLKRAQKMNTVRSAKKTVKESIVSYIGTDNGVKSKEIFTEMVNEKIADRLEEMKLNIFEKINSGSDE